jgi:hypothetical protein
MNFFSIGAPYIALASDWLPISTNWTGLMPMVRYPLKLNDCVTSTIRNISFNGVSLHTCLQTIHTKRRKAVERNFGNLAEMYALTLAVADYGIRPVMIDSLMVSDVKAPGEGWPWIDKLPMNRGCDRTILTDAAFQLPIFLHYCQRYEIEELKKKANQGMHKEPLSMAGGGNNGNRVEGERGAFWMFTK